MADFTDDTVQEVWEKAKVVPHYDPDKWRKDECNAWIRRGSYGRRDTPYGWEIDHIKPQSKGGSDDLLNLRPLQWENNASRQDNRLSCKITSKGERNVEIDNN